MPFTPRTRSAIRDSLLADLSARYAAIGEQLLAIPGSDAFLLADSLSVTLELFEFQALAQTKAILPDYADADSLKRHGIVDGVPIKAATGAKHTVFIQGTPGQTITFGSSVLTYNGVSYGNFTNNDTGAAITSVSLNGGGNTLFNVGAQALTPGSATTLPIGTILSWSSAPTNANPTASVTGIVAAGTDIESDPSYATRIIARRQSRPASGNVADWADWVSQYSNVVDVYVYPQLSPPTSYPGAGTPGTLGTVTVIPLTAAPGDTTGDRIFGGTSGAHLDATIEAYIEGTGGNGSPGAQPTGIQLRPVTMTQGNYSIEAAQKNVQNITLQCVMSAAYAFPWTYNAEYAVLSSPVPTTTTFSISGDVTSAVKPGGGVQPLLVNLGASNYRGGYYAVTPASVTYNGVAGRTDFVVPALPTAPNAFQAILPAPPNFAAIRTAIFALFDTLGPGDTSPPCRWPPEDSKGRSTLYLSAITGRIVQELDAFGAIVSGVRGVLSATVLTPSSTVTPTAKMLMALGILKVHV